MSLSGSWQMKPNLDCNYALPTDLAQQTEPKHEPYQLRTINNNNNKTINNINLQGNGMPVFSVYTHRESFNVFSSFKLNSDCNNTFPLLI